MVQQSAMTQAQDDFAIPGQQHTLSRLEFLIRSSSRFYLLHGPQGAGKTHLGKQLAAKCQDQLTATIRCKGKFTEAQLRQELICQLVSDQFVDRQQPLADTLAELVKQAAVPVLIIIDNAEAMPATVVAELWGTLVRTAAASPDQPVLNILLAAGSTWARKCAQSFPAKAKGLFNELELVAMTSDEARQFLAKAYPGQSDKQLDALLAPLPAQTLLPGVLLGLQVEQGRSGRLSLPIVAALATLVVGTALAAAWWLWYPAATDAEMPVAVETADTANISDDAVPDAAPERQPAMNDAVETEAMPAMASTAAEVPVDSEQLALAGEWQEVVSPPGGEAEEPPIPASDDVTDTVDDAAMPTDGVAETSPAPLPETSETPETAESNAIADSADRELPAEDEVEAETSADEILPAPTSQPASSDTAETDTAAVEDDDLLASLPYELPHLDELRDFLLLTPESHFSLMLGGFSSLETTRQVVQQLTDREELMIYRTQRNGSPWYVLLYGDFSDRAAAERQLAEMPVAFDQFSPWIKSFSLIRQELLADSAQ